MNHFPIALFLTGMALDFSAHRTTHRLLAATAWAIRWQRSGSSGGLD
jgi:uncharacterized membrane protein